MGIDPTSMAAYATHLSQAQLGQAISMKIARKQLDVAEQQGEAALALLQSAAKVAETTRADSSGKGGLIDVVA